MSATRPNTGTRLPNLWHAIMGSQLQHLPVGELEVLMPDGREHRFTGREPGPSARIIVKDPTLPRRLIAGGDIALAEGYLDGSWDTPDLDAVLGLGLANLSLGWPSGLPQVRRPLHHLLHAMNRNDPSGGAKRNISRHYDLGNEFFRRWLDPSMTYSSACIEDEELPLTADGLQSAQRRKWDRVLELISPDSRDHILEIGCGWGGFAIHAAKEAGCRVTGITISAQQAAMARRSVEENGLAGKVDIRLEDYRQVEGVYTGIASIEMFEAVGSEWWPVFFRRVRELLEPKHAAAFQVITIEEKRYEEYARRPDFTQLYIFPGGMLPSPQRFRAAAETAGLAVREQRFFGHDYAQTLTAWRTRFEQVISEVRALGYDERFIRMWRYYLTYCRTGFEFGSIDVMQTRLVRP